MEDVIARRKEKAALRRDLVSLLTRLAVLAMILWLVFSFCFLVTQVRGQDMFPAVKDGDVCVVFRRQAAALMGQPLQADDVITYTVDGKRRCGRVVAVSGDEVDLDGSGRVIVNGSNVSGEILFPTYPREGQTFPYTVPEGCVYVLGDHRTGADTLDSRDLGAIPLESVDGKVITILRRRAI